MQDDTHTDLSPLRIAMEHLLSHQQMPLDKAAACMASYAAMLTYEHQGLQSARAVIHAAMEQVALLACEDPDLDMAEMKQ
ncbi:hypothetical protein [Sphingobium sp. HWE2-09]|uniref:hypothetical protein n=1 Tax=Sphingobium sp. HWE2-09 TaxID=3108390 RepID=UPI002DCE8DFD|nr:hypothetical protein [Sphingobium sp. HWE2-09]